MGNARCGLDHDCVHCCDCPTEPAFAVTIIQDTPDVFPKFHRWTWDVDGRKDPGSEQERIIQQFHYWCIRTNRDPRIDEVEVEEYRKKVHNRTHKDD